jgi:hypothetical protein
MPLKLNVGLTKKLGLPDYGSIGASCHVEVELDDALLRSDLDRFQHQVRDAFIACRQAVHDELARHQGQSVQNTPVVATAPAPAPQPRSSPATRSASNGSNGRAASEKQLAYLMQLARRIAGLGGGALEDVSQRLYEKSLHELNSFEASSLIDTLKAVQEGTVQLPDLVGEEVAV